MEISFLALPIHKISCSFEPIMRRLGLYTCLLFFCKFAVGQTPRNSAAELEVKLTLADSSQRLILLLQLAESFGPVDTERALQYALESIQMAQIQDDTVSWAKGLLALGNIFQEHISEYDSALAYYFDASQLVESKKNLEYFVIQNAIAHTYQQVGEYAQALEILVNTELALEREGHKTALAQTQLELGLLYTQLNQLEIANSKLESALSTFRDNSNYEKQGDTWLALAQAHQTAGEWHLADSAYQLAITAYQQGPYPQGLGRAHLGKGQVDTQSRNYEDARTAWQSANGFFSEIGDLAGLAQVQIQLGALERTSGNYPEANRHFKASLEYALAVNDRRMVKNGYESLYNLSLASGDLEAAEEYKELFVAIGEFVFMEENQREIAKLQAQNDLERKELELKNLRQERELQELQLKQRNGERNQLFLLTMVLLMLAGAGFYFYIRIRRSNLALRNTNNQIHSQNEELEELNNTKDKFFSIIAHDVKGPLSSLRSFANLLIKYTDSLSKEEIQNLATDLDNSLKNLFSLLENLLTWARSQTGSLEFNPTSWELKKVIEETTEVLQPTAEKKNIQLSYQLPSTSEVIADRNMITTVIRNLISNALKFTEANGEVKVLVEPYVDAFEIAVIDNGVGMPTEIKQKLFKVGEKVTQKGTANEKGTGLGLILCKEFVEKNQGSIWVESEPDKGSTFRFTLPVSTTS
ncbi:MAG: ATP-binding protein [Bacteroidota bacterium]